MREFSMGRFSLGSNLRDCPERYWNYLRLMSGRIVPARVIDFDDYDLIVSAED